MSPKTLQNIKSIIFSLVVILGTTYVSAAWTPPPATPPNNNVAAPINAGGGTVGNIYSQFKTGLITLDHLITGDLTVTNPDGTVTGIPAGSVLVADGENTGKVKWGTVAAGGNCTPGASGVNIFDTFGTHTWNVPDGVTSVKLRMWGGGGNGGNGSATPSGYGGGGGGGGGGGYGEKLIQIPAGTQTYTVVLGGSDAQTQFGSETVGNGRRGATATNQSGAAGGVGGSGLAGAIISSSGGTGGNGGSGTPPGLGFAGRAVGLGGVGSGLGGRGGNGGGVTGSPGGPGTVIVEYTSGSCTGGDGATSAAVSSIIAGSGISVSPTAGTGNVTISAASNSITGGFVWSSGPTLQCSRGWGTGSCTGNGSCSAGNTLWPGIQPSGPVPPSSQFCIKN